MINKVILVGRLTKDLVLKQTTNGVANVQFVLAVNRTFTNQDGEREADFLLCSAWRKTAENMAKHLKKGSMIGVTGRLNSRHYEGKDGNRVYVTEVIAEEVQFLDKKSDNQQQQQGSTQSNHQQNYQQQTQNNQYQEYQQQRYEQQPDFQQSYQHQNQQQPQYAGSNGGYSGQSEVQQQFGNQTLNIPNDQLPFY